MCVCVWDGGGGVQVMQQTSLLTSQIMGGLHIIERKAENYSEVTKCKHTGRESRFKHRGHTSLGLTLSLGNAAERVLKKN